MNFRCLRAAGDLVAQFLSNIQKNLRSISDQDIIDKLSHDEPIAALKANATLLNVQRAVGLRPIINDYPGDARN